MRLIPSFSAALFLFHPVSFKMFRSNEHSKFWRAFFKLNFFICRLGRMIQAGIEGDQFFDFGFQLTHISRETSHFETYRQCIAISAGQSFGDRIY